MAIKFADLPKDRHFLLHHSVSHYERDQGYVQDGVVIEEYWFNGKYFERWCGNEFTHSTDHVQEEDIIGWAEIPTMWRTNGDEP